MTDLRSYIRNIPDFPKKGIVFRDITTLLIEPRALSHALDLMQDFCEGKKIDRILAIESRGFIFGGALADRMGIPFVPVRKAGKLPGKTIKHDYDLEYGSASIEIHEDALRKGDSVLIVDDLIATGGTLEATCRLVEQIGGKVAGIATLIDLSFLPWREKLGDYEILSLISYDSE